tara:strand:+ start:2964 stop:4259 length:1296 start_codon:yes stop_codon:yes gene_type:complete
MDNIIGPMAESESKQPKKPIPPKANAPKKPLQVIHISRKEEKSLSSENDFEANERKEQEEESSQNSKPKELTKVPIRKSPAELTKPQSIDSQENSEITMDDLLASQKQDWLENMPYQNDSTKVAKPETFSERTVDDFDFDEDEFLAALEENEPIGNTGEIAKGKVIAVESDGIYVDIGGKAPGFMPKNECGLGVITNLKERFPKDLEIEVLVTREQNADGMVTISCRALALRKSWDKVQNLEKEGKVVQVKINGFNRGGVTCDLEGLRGFIPRSQLDQGENHEALVGKIVGTAFLEVNPETKKLVLSEKKAAIALKFAELKVGQLVTGTVISIKPYGFFVDLGGISGLLHHSVITNGSFRSLREIFRQGDSIKAMITDLDPKRGRIGLNTALLESLPGELLIEKKKVMEQAEERAIKAQKNLINQEEKPLG